MTISVRIALLAAAIGAVVVAPVLLAQNSTVDEIAKYRAALQDGNPAELWEVRGEGLWKQKRGPKQASLEQCDLGLGPGVVKGAYAQLPRYFSDADRVMVRVGGMEYTCDPNAAMGSRISAMSHRGKPLEADKKYKVAGWAPVSEDAKAAGGEPIWDVMARYLRGQKSLGPRKLNVPKLVGVAGNPGIA